LAVPSLGRRQLYLPACPAQPLPNSLSPLRVSSAVPADSFRIKRALQLLHCDTPPAIHTTFRFDGAVAKQFYFLVKDTVRVITCPTQATDISNQAVCLANLGDQLDDYRPVSFSPEESGGYVVTLVPKGTVATYGLPTSASNPVLLPPPEGGQPGDARLHWNPILEPEVDIPCFAALPIARPVLPGDPAFDELPIGRDLDPNAVILAPMFARWFTEIQYLHQHHHGFSLHTGDTLFTWADVDAEGFSNLPLRTSPTILLEGIGTLDEHHVNMAAIFKAERLATFFRFSQHGTPALSSQPVPVPGLTGGVSAADLHALIQSLRTPTAALAPLPTTTSVERERAIRKVRVQSSSTNLCLAEPSK
jgi:hypothetical protein